MTGTLLLIIDMQHDFCSPAGSLYVNGADGDTRRLASFISENHSRISHIVLTQDNHHVADISHPVFWQDAGGNHPEPFTSINLQDVMEGKWIPRFHRGNAVDYIRKLAVQGEFNHTIWPEHCIIGSRGAAIMDEIMEPVKRWARSGRTFDLVTKGTNPLTEHFGALKANVPIAGFTETQLNTSLADKLIHAGKIIIAGEARSHCVATTIKQMLHIGGMARKLTILEDCMSDVPGFEALSLPVFTRARAEGARFARSTEYHFAEIV